MKILKILKLKNNKYKINFENESITTYDDIIINNNILYKKEIDYNLYNKIIEETSYYDNYNKVLKFSLKKVRCVNELENYIKNLNLNKDDEKNILNKILNSKIVNDKTYVESYINDKLLFSKDSINKIKKDLLNNKIDINVINEVLKKIDYNQEEKLANIIRKKIRMNHRYSNYILKNKIINEMVGFGYDSRVVEDIFEANKTDDYDIMIKEYQKLYNKLSIKYNDQQLELKIKSSLYNKGFKYDDIRKEDLIV